MPRRVTLTRRLLGAAICSALLVARAVAGEVSGRVVMSDLCSPGVSPAVVFLSTPRDRPGGGGASRASGPTGSASAVQENVQTIRLADFQFRPRIVALALGGGVRFERPDGEAHRILIHDPGAAGDPLLPDASGRFVPSRPGIFALECGVHLHMRGSLVVGPTPWVRTCTVQGEYRLGDVPAGRYVLTAWHEMGEPQDIDIDVPAGTPLVVPKITLSAAMSLGTVVRRDIQLTTPPVAAPIRPWREPLDRISILLASAREAVDPGRDLPRAARLLEDAYWGEFEASDLEASIRLRLGNEQAAAITGRFGDFRRALREVVEQRRPSVDLAGLSRDLLIDLGDAVRELNALGVIDNRPAAEARAAGRAAPTSDPSPLSRVLALQDFKRGLHRVQYHADRNVPEEAADAFMLVRHSTVPPLRDDLLARRPWIAWRLDRQLNLLQGELAAGLRGEVLADRLEGLESGLAAVHASLEDPASAGSLMPFAAVLVRVVASGLVAALVLPIAMGAGASWSLFLLGTAGFAAGLSMGTPGGAASDGILAFVAGWGGLVLCGLVFNGARKLIDPVVGPSRSLRLAGSLLLLVAAFQAAAAFRSPLVVSGPPVARAAAICGGLAALLLLGWVAWFVGRWPGWAGPRVGNLLSACLLFVLAVTLGGMGVFALQDLDALGVTPLPSLDSRVVVPGIYPSVEAVTPGLLVVAAACYGLVRSGRRPGAVREASETSPRPVTPMFSPSPRNAVEAASPSGPEHHESSIE